MGASLLDVDHQGSAELVARGRALPQALLVPRLHIQQVQKGAVSPALGVASPEAPEPAMFSPVSDPELIWSCPLQMQPFTMLSDLCSHIM